MVFFSDNLICAHLGKPRDACRFLGHYLRNAEQRIADRAHLIRNRLSMRNFDTAHELCWRSERLRKRKTGGINFKMIVVRQIMKHHSDTLWVVWPPPSSDDPYFLEL